MIIDKNFLKNNKNFLLVSIIIIVIFIIISLFTNMSTLELQEEDLVLNGEENYNKLVINEYMSSNGGTLIDEKGASYDWIELYNGTNKDINLLNYGLTDNENKVKWVFPNVTIKSKDYLIIYLSGTKEEGLYAPFKLSSSGKEKLALKNKSGKVVDMIETAPLLKGQSASRDLNGKFIITSMPTPGYANTIEGHDNLYKNKEVENNGLKITEILPKNNGNFILDGKLYGFVEITNISKEDISLSNYYLSNDINRLYKYKFEDKVLSSNESLVIYMGDSLNTDYLFSSFNLNNKNGIVYLSNNEGIIDKVEYKELPNGYAYTFYQDSYEQTPIISPGYSNTKEGVEGFAKKYLSNPKTLIINEVMNNNNSYLAQNGYKFYDWIELYNNSNETIDLSEYTLTTSTNSIEMYRLPNVKLEKGKYFVIMASGDTSLSNNYYHANFKLSDVDSLFLYKDKNIVDSVMIGDIPLNYSYGRGLENGFFYMENPTPLAQNKVGKREVSFAPTFSLKPGIYNEDVTIELSGMGDIYYTLDGSIPTNYSNKYKGSINLSKTAVIKAISYENGKVKSDVITNSYIVNENHTLPVVSLSTNNSDYKYLINNAWSDIEIKGHIEFYEDNGSFSIPCGIKMFGGNARSQAKKSFAIKFKSKYGESNLKYKIFDNRDTSIYNSIVLRSGSTDTFDISDNTYGAFFRDILGTSLVDEYTNVDTQAYKTVVLYINGKYYGVMNIREKVDDDFIEEHYNVDSSKLNMIQGVAKSTYLETKYGSRSFYDQILSYVKNNDMRKESNYNYIKEKIDIENYIDFWIAELFTANNDIINIRYFSHPDIDNGKMKMVFYDLDYAFWYKDRNYYNYMATLYPPSTYYSDTTLLVNLLKNEEFKNTFLERLSYNLKNTWSKENVLKKYNEIYESIYPEMERNQKRWDLTMQGWISACEDLKDFLENRSKYVLKHTKAYFNLSNEEYNKYFGGVE